MNRFWDIWHSSHSDIDSDTDFTFQDLFHVVKCSEELPSIDIMDALQSIVDKDAASTNFREQQKGKGNSLPLGEKE